MKVHHFEIKHFLKSSLRLFSRMPGQNEKLLDFFVKLLQETRPVRGFTLFSHKETTPRRMRGVVSSGIAQPHRWGSYHQLRPSGPIFILALRPLCGQDYRPVRPPAGLPRQNPSEAMLQGLARLRPLQRLGSLGWGLSHQCRFPGYTLIICLAGTRYKCPGAETWRVAEKPEAVVRPPARHPAVFSFSPR